jgi:hypothetical protein
MEQHGYLDTWLRRIHKTEEAYQQAKREWAAKERVERLRFRLPPEARDITIDRDDGARGEVRHLIAIVEDMLQDRYRDEFRYMRTPAFFDAFMQFLIANEATLAPFLCDFLGIKRKAPAKKVAPPDVAAS